MTVAAVEPTRRHFSVLSKALAFVRHHILTAYSVLFFAYLLLPIAVVVVFSFNATTSRFNYLWQGFTLDNWRDWDSVPGIRNALITSLEIAPFCVTYLIRTLAWETILSDNGFVVNTLQSLHILGPSGRLLATSTAVVTGITYNFLPFMALPLYVSLEQIDQSLIEAAEDLYASKWRAFWRVTFPLSLPGVVAGTLLTFIPAAGDFINAQLLGSTDNHMIGNVIQSHFLDLSDYPSAAAMSFILMAGILIAVFVYARAVGTEQLTGTAA